MGAMASQITRLTIVYSTVYSGADQGKHQSFAGRAFVTGELPAQMASSAENVSIWWRHHVIFSTEDSGMTLSIVTTTIIVTPCPNLWIIKQYIFIAHVIYL